MPLAPRVALASGLAAAAGGVLIVVGRVDASALTLVVLALVARAAPVAASAEPPDAARASSRHVALVPAWIGILVVAVVRAGSAQVADVRGANAVAGLAIAHGDPIGVAGVWLAMLAGAVALVAPSVGARDPFGVAVAPSPERRLEWVGLALQVLVLLTFFVGPQLTAVTDVVPWTVGAVAFVAVVAVARRFVWIERLPVVAAALAAIGVALILVADPL